MEHLHHDTNSIAHDQDFKFQVFMWLVSWFLYLSADITQLFSNGEFWDMLYIWTFRILSLLSLILIIGINWRKFWNKK